MNYEECKNIRQQVLKTDECCQKCKTTNHLVVHHIIPKRVGGKDNINNLVVLCRSCHRKVHHIMAAGAKNQHELGHCIDSIKGHQMLLDDDAYRILTEKRDQMKAGGIRASLSDAVRALETGDCHRRPRGTAGGA